MTKYIRIEDLEKCEQRNDSLRYALEGIIYDVEFGLAEGFSRGLKSVLEMHCQDARELIERKVEYVSF